MKGISKNWFLKSGLYRLRYYENPKRVSRTFKSRMDAECHLDSLTQELALPISFQISEEDRMQFNLFKRSCERYGISTQSAFSRLDEILRIEHSPKLSFERVREPDLFGNFPNTLILPVVFS